MALMQSVAAKSASWEPVCDSFHPIMFHSRVVVEDSAKSIGDEGGYEAKFRF